MPPREWSIRDIGGGWWAVNQRDAMDTPHGWSSWMRVATAWGRGARGSYQAVFRGGVGVIAPWKPGERCRLVNLQIGAVLDGKIEVVRGHKMVVQTDDGQRWSADVDSSFVQRPESANSQSVPK